MKTKDEGTAWLRSHGWVQCERGWRKRRMVTPIIDKQAAAWARVYGVSKDEKRAVAEIMFLMAEAVELAWMRNPDCSLKVTKALRTARGVLGVAGPQA